MYPQFSFISSSILLISISLINLVTMDPDPETANANERVNCRRVVFHPYCRGISAKRSLLQLQQQQQQQQENTKPDLNQQQQLPLNLWKVISDLNQQQQQRHRSIIDTEHSNQLILDNNENNFRQTRMMNIPIIITTNNGFNVNSNEQILTRRQSRQHDRPSSNTINRMFKARMVTYPQFLQIFQQQQPKVLH